jgi:hypothetical protein
MEQKMPDTKESFTIGKEELRTLLSELMGQARKMTPLEERRYKEELEAESRRNRMVIELGRVEEEAQRAKRSACTHTVDKSSGNSALPGAANSTWCTQGQVHSNDVISLICLRCSTVWYWKSTPAERDYAQNADHGLMGHAPPARDRVIDDISKA